MAEYINLKTKATIESTCELGGDWVLLESYHPAKEEIKTEKVEETKKPKKKKEPSKDELTVKKIKQELDAFSIKYNNKATKEELYKLMMKER